MTYEPVAKSSAPKLANTPAPLTLAPPDCPLRVQSAEQPQFPWPDGRLDFCEAGRPPLGKAYSATPRARPRRALRAGFRLHLGWFLNTTESTLHFRLRVPRESNVGPTEGRSTRGHTVSSSDRTLSRERVPRIG